MKSVVRITSPAELVAAVPWMLGYRPSLGCEAVVGICEGEAPFVACGVDGPIGVEHLPQCSQLMVIVYGRHTDPGPVGELADDVYRVVGDRMQINDGEWVELPDMSHMGSYLPPTLAEPAPSRDEMAASLLPEPCSELTDAMAAELDALSVDTAAALLPDMITRTSVTKNLAAAVAYLLGVESLFYSVVSWAGADEDRVGALIGVYRAAPDAISYHAGIAAYWAAWLNGSPTMSRMIATAIDGAGIHATTGLLSEPGQPYLNDYLELASHTLAADTGRSVGSLLH